MNTVRKYPAAKLPDELRGNIPLDAFVRVNVSDEAEVELISGYSQAEIDALLAPTYEQEEKGEYTALETRESIDNHFDALRGEVDRKYKA
jgi:hypothetical protein